MIQCSLGGRLGNQMFQYSIARIIAERNGYNFYIPPIGEGPLPCDGEPYHHIAKFFPNLDMGLRDGDLQYIYQEQHSQQFDPSLFTIPNFVRLCGYFQTEKYYDGYEDRIKEWFKLEMDDTTKNILDKYPVEEYCYIHFRAWVFGEGQTYTSRKYYIDAIERIKLLNPNIKVLIITDDMEVAKVAFPDDNFEMITNDMMIDFKLLYYSRYLVASCSSFSWWASWLSDNKYITVGPENWINYDKPDQGCYPIDVKSNKFVYV